MRAAPLVALVGLLLLLLAAAWWLGDGGRTAARDDGASVARVAPERAAPVAPPVLASVGGEELPPPEMFLPLPSTVDRILERLGGDLLSVERRPLPRPDARPRLVGRVTRDGEPAAGLRVLATLDRDVASASVGQLRQLASTYAEDEGFGELHPQSELGLLGETGLHPSTMWYLLRRSAETDGDGRFVLPLPAAGPLQLWVQQDRHDRGHWFPTQALVLEPGELFDLTLRLPAGRIAGQLVHDRTGEPLEPLPSLQVYDPRRRHEPDEPRSHRVLLIDGDGRLVRRVQADREGRFALADLPDGRYRLGVDRWQEVVVRDGVQEPAELLVPVRPPARLRGLVRRPGGGRSFRQEQVHCVPEDVPAWEHAALDTDDDRQRPLVTVGRTTRVAEPLVHDTRIGSFRFDELPAGRYRLAVGAGLTVEDVLRDGLAVDASLGGDHELTLVTRD